MLLNTTNVKHVQRGPPHVYHKKQTPYHRLGEGNRWIMPELLFPSSMHLKNSINIQTQNL